MKIKTIKNRLNNAEQFDKELNRALADGYQLIRRDIVPGFSLTGGGCLHNMLYAEMVLPDPAPDPEPVEIDAIQALHIVKDACLAHSGSCNECQMYEWCEQLRTGGDPTDWHLPEV